MRGALTFYNNIYQVIALEPWNLNCMWETMFPFRFGCSHRHMGRLPSDGQTTVCEITELCVWTAWSATSASPRELCRLPPSSTPTLQTLGRREDEYKDLVGNFCLFTNAKWLNYKMQSSWTDKVPRDVHVRCDMNNDQQDKIHEHIIYRIHTHSLSHTHAQQWSLYGPEKTVSIWKQQESGDIVTMMCWAPVSSPHTYDTRC